MFTLEQVSGHNHAKDCWLIIDGKVSSRTLRCFLCGFFGMAVGKSDEKGASGVRASPILYHRDGGAVF